MSFAWQRFPVRCPGRRGSLRQMEQSGPVGFTRRISASVRAWRRGSAGSSRRRRRSSPSGSGHTPIAYHRAASVAGNSCRIPPSADAGASGRRPARAARCTVGSARTVSRSARRPADASGRSPSRSGRLRGSGPGASARRRSDTRGCSSPDTSVQHGVDVLAELVEERDQISRSRASAARSPARIDRSRTGQRQRLHLCPALNPSLYACTLRSFS
jgi:hypothetical protein